MELILLWPRPASNSYAIPDFSAAILGSAVVSHETFNSTCQAVWTRRRLSHCSCHSVNTFSPF